MDGGNVDVHQRRAQHVGAHLQLQFVEKGFDLKGGGGFYPLSAPPTVAVSFYRMALYS